MVKPLLADSLWQLLESILPTPKLRRKDHPDRQPIGNRQAPTGILFVLKTATIPIQLNAGIIVIDVCIYTTPSATNAR